MEKTIAILGVTGSVGTQAVDVARKSNYKIDFITANKDVRGVEAFVREFSPRAVAMADESAAKSLKTLISDTATRVYSGNEGILEGILETKAETVINSIIGEAGLLPSLAVIDSGKRLALANKESLVIAGDIVMKRAKEKNVEIIPVDSEHSAIFQSMKAGRKSEVKKLILTASGGPFFGKTKEELERVTLSETLAHPTWKMGRKITVDSATLMNKGFEIIEAAHLFSVGADKIEVVIHRESILHSAVEYIDNTVIGEFSVPDMRMCVGYAVDYPDRNEAVADELDLIKLGKLTFMKPDTEAFPLLALAGRAMSLGGAMPAVVNAADEIAVGAFLDEKISFADIPKVVISTFEKMTAHANDRTLEEILTADREAREIARGEIA
jgi:1-deoxy-D-xylulose-5-phosphate reductoisomerase